MDHERKRRGRQRKDPKDLIAAAMENGLSNKAEISDKPVPRKLVSTCQAEYEHMMDLWKGYDSIEVAVVVVANIA